MTIDPDTTELVTNIAHKMGSDPWLILAVMQAEGGPAALVKAVACSVKTVQDLPHAIEITCRSANHALSDYVKFSSRDRFVDFWASRWAPQKTENDPTDLNAHWPVNVKALWTA